MEKVKITFLGTGPSPRIPRPGCKRPSCRDARKPGSRSRRLQQSLLLQHGKTTLLFDASEDILKQWHHVGSIRRLDAVLISHPHSDAMGGLAKLKVVMRRLGQDNLSVYAENKTWARAHERFSSLDFLDQRHLRIGTTVRIDSVSIRPFRVEHTFKSTHPTVGFAIDIDRKHIVLMPDVKKIPMPSWRAIGHPDLLVMDCAIFKDEMYSHVNLPQALDIIARVRSRHTILTQIGVTWPPYAESRRIARRHGVEISYDGLRINV